MDKLRTRVVIGIAAVGMSVGSPFSAGIAQANDHTFLDSLRAARVFIHKDAEPYVIQAGHQACRDLHNGVPPEEVGNSFPGAMAWHPLLPTGVPGHCAKRAMPECAEPGATATGMNIQRPYGLDLHRIPRGSPENRRCSEHVEVGRSRQPEAGVLHARPHPQCLAQPGR